MEMEEINDNIIPEWTDLFPGSDLSTVKELRITIIPQEFPGFWPQLIAALQVSCQDVLLQRKLPGALRITFQDMKPCLDLENTSESLAHDAVMVKANFTDYKAALVPFQALTSKIDSCEVILPYWMEFAKNINELRQNLREELKAQTLFTPLNLSCCKKELIYGVEHEDSPWELEDGAPVRFVGWSLAELADAELESSKRGLRERFAATGSWIELTILPCIPFVGVENLVPKGCDCYVLLAIRHMDVTGSTG